MARAQGASLPGTAPVARGYLLVEYAGPWPKKAFADNPVDPEAGQRIVDRTSTEAVRPLFIRRPGSRYAPDQRDFAWAFVDATTGVATWHEPAPLSVIANVNWPDPSSALSSAQTADSQSLYLIRTNGRRDQCCATLGRPVAAAFAQIRPEQTWECSHLGGHRLASVVVVLPRGDIYGLVDPEVAPQIVSATEAGHVLLPYLRGCSTDEPPVQAAKIAVLGERLGANLRVLRTSACNQVDDTSTTGDPTWLVDLRDEEDPGGTWTVEVIRRPGAVAPASCGKDPSETFTWQASGGHQQQANLGL